MEINDLRKLAVSQFWTVHAGRVRGSVPRGTFSDLSDEGVADCTRSACAPQNSDSWLSAVSNPCPLTIIYASIYFKERARERHTISHYHCWMGMQ
jgi:hypothetical protein